MLTVQSKANLSFPHPYRMRIPRLGFALLIGLCFPLVASTQTADDAIERRLRRSQDEHTAIIERQRELLTEQLETRIETAKRNGDLDLFEAASKELHELLKKGRFPTLVRVSRARSAVSRANNALTNAFEIAEQGYVKAGLIKDAKRIRAEREQHEAAAKSPSLAIDESRKWVQLFNGRDLTGFVASGSKHVKWRVENGILTGTSSRLFGELSTKTSNYKNFHFRVETVLVEGGNSCQFVRGAGHRVFIGGTSTTELYGKKVPGAELTGDLFLGQKELADAPSIVLRPGEWFTQEVICAGDRYEVLVNGKKVVDYVDKENKVTPGSLGVMCRQGSVVRFRRIEVKELPDVADGK